MRLLFLLAMLVAWGVGIDLAWSWDAAAQRADRAAGKPSRP